MTDNKVIDKNLNDINNCKELGQYIKADFKKINPCGSNIDMLKSFLIEPGFKFCVYLRVTRFFWLKGKLWLPFFLISCFILKHYAYKYGFDISYRTIIGSGLSISHFGTVIVAAESIGDNCSLRPGVVIGGNLTRGGGNPIIGNNVEFGVGCKVIGNITIGDYAVIGANAVVTKNVPKGVIVAGIPAKVIRSREV